MAYQSNNDATDNRDCYGIHFFVPLFLSLGVRLLILVETRKVQHAIGPNFTKIYWPSKPEIHFVENMLNIRLDFGMMRFKLLIIKVIIKKILEEEDKQK